MREIRWNAKENTLEEIVRHHSPIVGRGIQVGSVYNFVLFPIEPDHIEARIPLVYTQDKAVGYTYNEQGVFAKAVIMLPDKLRGKLIEIYALPYPALDIVNAYPLKDLVASISMKSSYVTARIVDNPLYTPNIELVRRVKEEGYNSIAVKIIEKYSLHLN